MSSSDSFALAIPSIAVTPSAVTLEDWSPIGSSLGKCIGISNSEVTEYTKCRMAWLKKYHPELLLSPISMGVARLRGIIGHSALEIFYKHLKDGASYDAAKIRVIQYLNKEYDLAENYDDVDKMSMVRKLRTLVVNYLEYYKSDFNSWEIISIEAFHSMKAPEITGFYLPMRLDLVVYMKTGKYKGEICAVDHKFVYDFWPKIKMDMNSQIPLYIRALRESIKRGEIEGHPNGVVNRSILNFVRYRELADAAPHDYFHREYLEPEPAAYDNVFNNHMGIAAEIEEIKRLPLEEAVKRVKYNLSGMSCQYCDFKRICVTELHGGNPANEIRATMEKSTYGYPPLEEF